MPITHKWNGTVLTITSDSGSSSCDLLGPKGDDGPRGITGPAGGTCYKVAQAAYNHLDNTDFRNPINQRGNSSYTGSEIYSIDRWKLGQWSNGSVAKTTIAIENGGVRLTGGVSGAANSCYIRQIISAKPLRGKTITCAVKVADLAATATNFFIRYNETRIAAGRLIANSIAILTGVVPEDAETVDITLGNQASWGGNGTFNGLIEWAAIYEGEYTIDTLPAYQPKGYAAELAECMRYYQRIDGAKFSFYSYAGTEKYFFGSCNFPMIMRNKPTITIPTVTVSGIGALSNATPYSWNERGIYQIAVQTETTPDIHDWCSFVAECSADL